MKNINEIELFRLINDDQLGEDPYREPHEKETALHMEGGSSRFTITTLKAVVFRKLLQHPEFEVKWLNILDGDGRESSVECLDEILKNPDLTVIGVTGTLPVGCLSIGTPRKSNSHAQIVKTGVPDGREVQGGAESGLEHGSHPPRTPPKTDQSPSAWSKRVGSILGLVSAD